VEWKLLPKEVLKEAGSRKASLEGGWETVEGFVAHLQDIIEKESEVIRETDLGGAVARTVDGAVIKVAGKRDPFREDVEVDALGRVHLPEKFYGKRIEGINIGPGMGIMQRVVKVEERFKGERPSKVVCYLEER
jgi:hypothetical protein